MVLRVPQNQPSLQVATEPINPLKCPRHDFTSESYDLAVSRAVQSQLRKTRFTHSCLCDRKDQIPQLAVCESPGEVYLLNIFFSLLPTSVTRQVGASVKGWGKFFGKSKAFKFTTLSDKVSKTLASPEGPLSNNGDGWLLPFLAKKTCSCDYVKGLEMGTFSPNDLYGPPCHHRGFCKYRRETGERQAGRSEDAKLRALMMKGEAVGQGMQEASRSWKSQKDGFSLRASSRSRPCQHLDLSPARPISDL